MYRNNGFTLIELLAVIVIFGFVSVIVVPRVINNINYSKRVSYESSVNNLVDTLNRIALDKKANLIPFDGCSYNFDSGINTCTDLEFSGKLPSSGSISVDGDGVVNGSVGYGDITFSILNNSVTYGY